MTAAPQTQSTSPLNQPVTSLRGVGPERAAQLARLKIFTVEDLLLHRPRRYEDRRHFRAIRELALNEAATTRGTVAALGVKRFRHGQKSMFELILDDGTARLHCRWWNLPFMEKYFAVGDEVVVFGKCVTLKPRTMDHPETEVVEKGEEHFIHFNRITPVYPLTEGLPQRWLRSLIWRMLEQVGSQIEEPWPGAASGRAASQFAPSVTGKRREQSEARCSFPGRAEAVHTLHFPETIQATEHARRRLALDEFIDLQVQIRLRRQRFEAKAQALPCGGDNRLMKPFLATLGFHLTEEQTNVLREIRADLRGPHPMRRLLQGDVGSGKTVVAACATLMALESGYDVALMAPTEILAEQHFRNFQLWMQPLGVAVRLQTGSRNKSNGEHPTSSIQRPASNSNTRETSNPLPASRCMPHAALTIGTHALLTQTEALTNLGLVIIDEQHKFGVAQREQLVGKGHYPHLLVMTATPIPRTLGLTLYGDLDISVIRRSPPGRGRIKTFVRSTESLPKVWAFVKNKLAEGRQAYVVYPRIEETGTNGVKAVTREFSSLEKCLAPFRVGLIHGRMKSKAQAETMSAFRANTVQVLLATSLIEVGVDVPNATLMLVENAEQFGLAQLHQLRGRIGRGAHVAFCILVSNSAHEEAWRRLQILADTSDGFQVAEADLALRGPGDLVGRQQSGLPNFRFGDLTRDADLIQLARERARQTVAG